MTPRKTMTAAALGLATILAAPASAQLTEDIYISASGSGTAGAVSFGDEDIVLCDRSGGTCDWSMFFDGSDVGLSPRADISAFHVEDDMNVLMAFQTPKKIGGLKKVDDSDIVRFTGTTGPGTSGTFQFHFDGSDVGLDTDDESIDAIGFDSLGRLVISTDGDYSVDQTGGGTLSGGDEDLIVFNGTTTGDTNGATTAGTWELFFDGSQVTLTSPQEDVGGAWIDPGNDDVYLTTRGNFSISGGSGTGTDIFICVPAGFEPIAACSSVDDSFFDAATENFNDKIVDGIFVINNSPPVITGGPTASVNVDEGTTFVVDVDSTDPDGDTEGGGGLVYSFTTVASGGADNSLFSIDADGMLTFDIAPDFENPGDADMDNDYEVQVTVTDSQGLTDLQDITVTVVNVQDGDPTITSSATVNVDENTTFVIDVQSTDPDDSEGAGLTYELTAVTGGVDNSFFAIDIDTGVLTFNAAPNFEDPLDQGGTTPNDNIYDVEVTVTDSGPGTPLTDQQNIAVTVTNVNEDPVISAPAMVSIDENTTAVTDVNATDPDGDTEGGGGLTYSLTGLDSALFTIDANGNLSFLSAPDHENPTDNGGNNVYDVRVTVTDSGPGTPLTDFQDIAVTVDDVAVEVFLPTANDDGYNATGNVSISVNEANGVILSGGGAGADDDGAGTITVTQVQGVGANVGSPTATGQTGSVTVAADGSFTYDPPAGFEGDDTFTYQITNAAGSDTATVTITVADMIWFIDNNVSSGGNDGRLSNPFETLGAFVTANTGTGDNPAAGDCIFLHTGSGNYTGGVTLLNNQTLLGQGSSGTFSGRILTECGITLAAFTTTPLPTLPGTDPVIVNAGGNGINVGTGNTIRGLNIGDISGTGISGGAVGTLTVNQVAIGDGTPSGGGIEVSTSGALAVTLDSLSASSSSDEGINLNGVTGSFAVTGATGTISTTGMPAVAIDGDNTLGVTVNATFASLTSTNSTTNGVFLTDLVGSSVFNGGATTVSNATGVGINIVDVGGTADLDFGTTAVNNRNATGIFVDEMDGTALDFGATTIANPNSAGGYGIRVEDSSAAVTFASATISDANLTVAEVDTSPNDSFPDNDGDGDGIFLKNNSAAGFSFTVNGGSITNSDNDGIDIRTSRNVSLDGVTIDNIGVATSGSRPSGVKAINLSGTGSLIDNSLIEDFDIAAVSGSGHGILWTNGDTNGTLTVQDTIIRNGAVDGNAGIQLVSLGSSDLTLNVLGDGDFSTAPEKADSCIFTNIFGDGVLGSAGDGAGLGTGGGYTVDIDGCLFIDAPNPGTNGIELRSSAGDTVDITIQNSRLENIGNGAFAGIILFPESGSSTMTADVDGNELEDVGTIGIQMISLQTTAAVTLTINDNDINDLPQEAFLVFQDDDTVGSNVRITNNRIGNVTPVGTAAGAGSYGARITARRLGAGTDTTSGKTMNLLISGNTITNAPPSLGFARETLFINAEDERTLNATIINNTLVQAGTGGSADDELRFETENSSTACLDFNTNTVGSGSGTVTLDENAGSTFNIVQASAAALATANGIPSGNVSLLGSPNFGAVVSCPTPPAPAP